MVLVCFPYIVNREALTGDDLWLILLLLPDNHNLLISKYQIFYHGA